MAAAEATEVFGKSEAGSISKDGQRTVTRMFHVEGTYGENLTLQYALVANNLPAEPTDGTANSTITVGGVTLSYWGTRSFQRVTGHEDLWSLSYEYSTSPDPSGGGEENDETGGVRATTKGVYRVGFTLPASIDDPSQDDISGKSIDVGGQKTTVVFQEATITIKEFVNYRPNIARFAMMVGKRNSEMWNGLKAGVVLFIGVRYAENKATSRWELEYEYAVDFNTYHLEQVASTDPDGKVLPKSYGEGDNTTFVAKHVKFVQPFGKVSFWSLPT